MSWDMNLDHKLLDVARLTMTITINASFLKILLSFGEVNIFIYPQQTIQFL